MRAPEFFFLQDSIFFKFIVWLLFGINFNKLMLLPLWQGYVCVCVPPCLRALLSTAGREQVWAGCSYHHHSSKHDCQGCLSTATTGMAWPCSQPWTS